MKILNFLDNFALILANLELSIQSSQQLKTNRHYKQVVVLNSLNIWFNISHLNGGKTWFFRALYLQVKSLSFCSSARSLKIRYSRSIAASNLKLSDKINKFEQNQHSKSLKLYLIIFCSISLWPHFQNSPMQVVVCVHKIIIW